MSEPHATKSTFAELFGDKSRRAFLLRKLHSLSGALPVGGFMLFHFWTNAKALQGQEVYDQAIGEIAHMPYLPVLEWGLVLLPLLFHALYGVKLAMEGKPNVGRYPYSRNWMYTLQRVTGIVAFAFIAFHLYEYWGQKFVGKMTHHEFYGALSANLSSTVKGVPVHALVYVFGIAACAFHFANGLWGFCFSWGITVSRRSQQAAAVVLGLAGLVVFLFGANTALHFATGSALGTFGAPADGKARPLDTRPAPTASAPR